MVLGVVLSGRVESSECIRGILQLSIGKYRGPDLVVQGLDL